MVIIGWIFILCVALYLTVVIVGSNLISLAFSGNSVGKIENIIGSIVLIAIWYAVFEFVPFTISVN